MKKFAVFVSGSGSNLQAIIDAVNRGYIPGNIALVVSDNPQAYAVVRAKNAGIETFVFNPRAYPKREDYEEIIIQELNKREVEFIVLAGFMRVLTPFFIRKYKNKILNIHPALLPSFPGTHGVRDALNYGVKVTGVTVHFVDEGIDTGPIILQEAEKVRDDDSEESLHQRLHEIEHRIYPKAIKLFIEDKLVIEGRKVKLKGGEDED
ncbi:MAG: phosphoribosylglycinamide formyltransferase [Candidatus Omnitrophota bacterium]|nr:MAG: phosphoribosylglycinamide formyltransferase [Candidatus Omnitrophota bacterium]